MGNVVGAGLGQAPARQAALRGGLADHVAALTINKVCGSGLKAVMLAAQGIATGDIDVAVAGGMESMSNAPYLLARVREGLRMGNSELVDSMINDGLWCSFEQCHMGHAGEVVATEYQIAAIDRTSTRRTATARPRPPPKPGPSMPRSCQLTSRSGTGATPRVTRDESIRPDTTADTLAALKPAFRPDGTVTAGNAPPVNDGAAALVVMRASRAAELNLKPLARIVGQATSGLAPKNLLMTPVEAVRKLAAKIGWTLADVDLLEINEAFSVQLVAILDQLGVDPARVNVHGGAVALGHPIGASGARRPDDLAVCARTAQRARHRQPLPWRRKWRRTGHRAALAESARRARISGAGPAMPDGGGESP